MKHDFYNTTEKSEIYQKYMIREPEEVRQLILSYLHEKENSFGLAVDVGCGTGQSTRTLVPYFKKVVGVDIGTTQVEKAERFASFPNLSYLLGSAEELPFQDGTVDLVTASVAAHWFKADEFLREVDRVLTNRGCMALYTLDPYFKLQYEGCSEKLTSIFLKEIDFLIRDYGAGLCEVIKTGYKEIFDATPFAEKQRVTNILLKRYISVAGLLGHIQAAYFFQNYKSADPQAATNLLKRLQDRTEAAQAL